MSRPRLDRLLQAIFPELRAIPGHARARAWRRASTAPFDAIELGGMALAVVAVTWLTRRAVESLGPMERFAETIANGAVALPLLALALAPIAWRRTRRALRATGNVGEPAEGP